jgi:hypothetical protein
MPAPRRLSKTSVNRAGEYLAGWWETPVAPGFADSVDEVLSDQEEGTTTTPFDILKLNDLDRFHLVMDVIDRVPKRGSRSATLRQAMADERLRHRTYTRDVGDDTPTFASGRGAARFARQYPGPRRPASVH